MKRPWTLSGAPRPKFREKWVPQSFGLCRHCGRERRCVHRCRLPREMLLLLEEEEQRMAATQGRHRIYAQGAWTQP